MGPYQELAREFVRKFVDEHEVEHIDAKGLAAALDRMAIARWECYAGDYDADFDYTTVIDWKVLRERVCRVCPWLSYYAFAIEQDADPGAAEVDTADAVDDLVDILQEIMRTLDRCDSLGSADGSAYFAWSYDVHWGMHLRCLQLFVYHHSCRW